MSATKLQSTTTVSGKRMTPFGAVEDPEVLTHLPGSNVVRVDALCCLREMWGDNILMSRQHLYEIVSGDVCDKTFQELISSYYRRYAAFANYADEKYLFESATTPFVTRLIAPARKAIDARAASAHSLLMSFGYTYLGTHQDYWYYQCPEHTSVIPALEGVERIC